MRLIVQPDASFRLGDFLKTNLTRTEWTEFKAAVAFAKLSGVRHIQTELIEFGARALIRIAVGVDHRGTSREGLSALMQAVEGRGDIFVFHNEGETTFHPKLYLFRGPQRTRAHDSYLALCTRTPRGSNKRWGYYD